jgi:parvulin-like peptidyl-prolyl isomerase
MLRFSAAVNVKEAATLRSRPPVRIFTTTVVLRFDFKIPKMRGGNSEMRYLVLFFYVLMNFAVWAQDSQNSPGQKGLPPQYLPPSEHDDGPTALPASAAKVGPNDTVLTIKGFCSQTQPSSAGAPSSPSSCETVITRAQFEELADAIVANMTRSRRQQLAGGYPNLLVMAHEAQARGIENSPRFQERLAFARVQILSQELIRQIDDDAAKISDKDVEDYYHAHTSLFERAALERIFIPLRKRMEGASTDKNSPEDVKAREKEAEDAMTHEAEELRAKALAGGSSFLTLQKEAYAAAGHDEVPPNPSLGEVRSSDLPPAYSSVFDLKAGEVSQVFTDSNGHYIYKVVARKTESLEEATSAIRKILQHQREEAAIQAIQEPISTEVNTDYFGPSEKPGEGGTKKSK